MYQKDRTEVKKCIRKIELKFNMYQNEKLKCNVSKDRTEVQNVSER